MWRTSLPSNDDGLYGVTYPWVPIPVGFVQTRFFEDGLVGVNVTTRAHPFVGEVERRIVNRADGGYFSTHSFGAAPRGYISTGLSPFGVKTGPLRDMLNDALGPGAFEHYDNQARRYARHHFEGC